MPDNCLKHLFPLTLVSSALLHTVPALAQGSAPALEEVVVTAQRREQNVQDVPISVSVFSGSELQQRNITNAVDYLVLTPGVSFTEDGQTGSRGMGIAIRGVNNMVTGENAFVNSVGIYLDEFSVASVPNNVANPNLSDMDRVEVLRGPQGTFFGRNAVGGALNLTTKKPTDEFEGEVILGGENYEEGGDQYNATGILNVPVSDDFRMRGVVYYMDSDGFIENACRSGASASDCPAAAQNGFTPNGADGSKQDSFNGRLHLDWNLSDQTNVLGSIYYTDDSQDTDENVPSGVLDLDSIDSFGITQALDPGTGFWYNGNYSELSHDLSEKTDNKSTVSILNITHQLNDRVVIKSITGYIDASLDRTFDNDLIGGLDALKRTNSYDGDSWSTELRMEFTEDKYDFIGGVLYASDEQKQDNNVAISSQPTATLDGVGLLPPFPEGLGLALNNKKWELESIAVFGDLTWHTTDKLDLIVGARYTDDTVKQQLQAYGTQPTCCFPGSPGFPPPPGFDFYQSFVNFERPPASGQDSFNDVSPRFVARYQATDSVNVWGTISKGYKAGGLSLGNNTNLDDQPAFSVEFKEESIWNYEVGVKSELLDNRLRLNGSVYYLQWSDIQMEAFRFLTAGDLSSNFEQTINIDDAEAMGGELELQAAITDRLTFSAAAGYTDTEITSNSSAEITGGFLVDLKGLDLPKAPEWTYNATLEYRFPIGANEMWVQLDYIHRDGQYADIEALTYQQTDGPSPTQGLARNSIATFGDYPFRTPDYDVWNLRAGFDMGQWSFNAFVQNLDEENYYTGTQENFGASGYRLRPNPRTIGGNVTYRF
ncbi:MAG: TonB-dependent receptor [Haliea sp.]|nr:TonB-dependent receptor [Haliea sp.]